MNTAVLLLSDNFTVTGIPNPGDLNFNLAGRQRGSLAPVGYNGFINAQVGNLGEPHDGGNVLLVAAGGNAALDRNFNGVDGAGGWRLSAEFDPNPHANGDLGVWAGVVIGASGANRHVFVIQSPPHFGIIFRANGKFVAFDGDRVLTPPGEINWAPTGNYSRQIHRFEILCTDPNDGNPFDGLGDTVIRVFVDGSPIPFFYLHQSGWLRRQLHQSVGL